MSHPTRRTGSEAPVLVACSHGTRSNVGRRTVLALLEQVRHELPGVTVTSAFVDVQDPRVDVVADAVVARGTEAVVVPLLLSTGHHTEVDIARAVAAHQGTARATPPLGPHPLLVDVLESRLASVGFRSDDAVVLASAGSSDPRAGRDVQEMAGLLSERLGLTVTTGAAAGPGTRIDDAVHAARRSAPRVVAASYVLAPGYFSDVIMHSGADVVTATLAPDERVARLVAERYLAAWAPLELVGASA